MAPERPGVCRRFGIFSMPNASDDFQGAAPRAADAVRATTDLQSEE